MPRFSNLTLARVRKNVNEMLTETCTLERETAAVGRMGEPLHDQQTVQTSLPCRVIRAGRRSDLQTMPVGGQEAMVEMYRLICPVGTAFTKDDRVTMTDGRMFQVVSVEDGLSDEAFAAAIITRVR